MVIKGKPFNLLAILSCVLMVAFLLIASEHPELSSAQFCLPPLALFFLSGSLGMLQQLLDAMERSRIAEQSAARDDAIAKLATMAKQNHWDLWALYECHKHKYPKEKQIEMYQITVAAVVMMQEVNDV